MRRLRSTVDLRRQRASHQRGRYRGRSQKVYRNVILELFA